MSVIEKLIEERKLPELLKFTDGREVTAENWEERRQEILEVLSREEYGYAPPAPKEVKVVSEDAKMPYSDFAGKAVSKTLTFTVETDAGEFTFPATEIVPISDKPRRTFVLINFRPEVPDRYYPTEELIDTGCAVIQLYYNDIAFDGRDDFKGGIAPMFDRTKYTWGKIRMWAWAASRVMDYLQTADYCDKEHIAVVGHSRLGKTALVCAAFDTRFAMACVNNSGCSGDSITRGKKGERIRQITHNFPFWFCDDYQKYIDKEDEMPFEQHWLVAAVAPRKVALGSALEDEWADPESSYLSACAASPAWELNGKTGFVHPDRMPEVGDYFAEGDIKYHLRGGKHFLSRKDWAYYADALNKI